MAWTWEMSAPEPGIGTAGSAGSAEPQDGAEGVPAHGAPAAGFGSQADAESWLGQVWRGLAESGVRSVSLYEDGRLVYGPMSLEAS